MFSNVVVDCQSHKQKQLFSDDRNLDNSMFQRSQFSPVMKICAVNRSFMKQLKKFLQKRRQRKPCWTRKSTQLFSLQSVIYYIKNTVILQILSYLLHEKCVIIFLILIYYMRKYAVIFRQTFFYHTLPNELNRKLFCYYSCRSDACLQNLKNNDNGRWQLLNVTILSLSTIDCHYRVIYLLE